MDVAVAMALAGAVNLAMVVLAAAALKGTGADSLDAAHGAIGDRLGHTAALLFALALLASGFASSSVGLCRLGDPRRVLEASMYRWRSAG